MPITIAAMKPNDISATSTFSRIVSSIVASYRVTPALGGLLVRHALQQQGVMTGL